VIATRWAVRAALAPTVLVLALASASATDDQAMTALADTGGHSSISPTNGSGSGHHDRGDDGHSAHDHDSDGHGDHDGGHGDDGHGDDGHDVRVDACGTPVTRPHGRRHSHATTTAPASKAPSRATATSTVVTCLPAVAFQVRATSARGRVRTAFLINIAEVRGSATIVGASGCSVEARPGVPAWLDCRYDKRATQVTVQVRLRDHRLFTTTLPVVAA